MDNLDNFKSSTLNGMILTIASLKSFEQYDYAIVVQNIFENDNVIIGKLHYIRVLITKIKDIYEQSNSSENIENIYEFEVRNLLPHLYVILQYNEVNRREFSKNDNLEKNISEHFKKNELDFHVDRLSENVDKFINMLILYISIDDFNHNRVNQRVTREKVKEVDKSIISIKNFEIIAKDIVDKIGLLPNKNTIDNYSKMFKKEAWGFRVSSFLWMIGIGFCLYFIIVFLNEFNVSIKSTEFDNYKPNRLILLNVSRVLFMSTLFYILAICNKNFKASMHNQIVNKHRSNALASFQAFVGTQSADDATKNAVLLEATRTIYSAQATGYMPSETEDSSNKIIEVINSFNKKDK